MKISWLSNAPWAPTGYGTQTAQVTPRLKALGHDVAILANYGLSGMRSSWQGIPVYPMGMDKYSNDIAPAHHVDHLAGERGWLISLYDTWVLIPPYFDGLDVASWVPIDHDPVPPAVARWCEAHTTITMSRFGQQALAAKGIASTYIPHAIDVGTFKPTDALPGGTPFREAVNVPADAFLVTINAANQGTSPPRKGWSEMFGAMARFMAVHKDAYLYLHTFTTTGYGGIDLHALAGAWGLPGDRVRFVGQYEYQSGRVPQSALAAIYTASDVLLATSKGEGFGIPVIEAQSCGLPVIVSDFSAQPELVGAGWTVGGQRDWNAAQGSFFFTPDIGQIVARLEEAYELRGNTEVRRQAIEFAQQYDADAVFIERWVPFLAELEKRITPDTRPRNVRRAERRKAAKCAR